ncbi:MAG: alpha/beta fold hydrolase [Candidatus Dormibacteraeota bacterium]|nr:alpha/beta fold hydrolase [Candidatus Dormibacteraeota bacterium]
MTATPLQGVRDQRLEREGGRTVAWSEFGDPAGLPLLRVPGTPGCRYSLRADRTPWIERGLRVITTERPGFGASTRLPGRGFAEPADDLAAILDHLELDAVHVMGGSGAAPHELAFAARHPERVRAMTVLVGAAPITDDESRRLIGINAEAYRLVREGDLDGLRALQETVRTSLLEDPVAAMRTTMDRAPDADRAVMDDPLWQEGWTVAIREALRVGVDGWLDEAVAVLTPWNDVDLGAVRTSVTWWHAAGDANAPLSAAQRVIAAIPRARLVTFGDSEGHLAPYRSEAEILDELLARG